MAIRKAPEHVPGRDHLSWGKFLQAAVTKRSLGDFEGQATSLSRLAGSLPAENNIE